MNSPLKDLFHSKKLRYLRLLLSHGLSCYTSLQKTRSHTYVFTEVTEVSLLAFDTFRCLKPVWRTKLMWKGCLFVISMPFAALKGELYWVATFFFLVGIWNCTLVLNFRFLAAELVTEDKATPQWRLATTRRQAGLAPNRHCTHTGNAQ